MKRAASPLVTSFLALTITACGQHAPEESTSSLRSPLIHFTTQAADERDAAWSPDGKWIAFGSGTGIGNEDIWIKEVDGGKTVQLTDGPASDNYPIWSPDGKWIAFTSNRSGSGNVWILPAAGGASTQVTADADSVSLEDAGGSITSWSADGKWIAFTAERNGSGDIWIIPAAGGSARQLTNDPGHARHPSWSADGKWIAFSLYRSDSPDIWIIPAAGGSARQLTTHSAADWAPDWSPDGEWIAFSSRRKDFGDADIWIIPVKGGSAVQVTGSPDDDDRVPRWSPDGRKIAFNTFSTLGEIWVMSAAGTELVRLADKVYSLPKGEAIWSPDGEQIAFIAPGPEGREVWKIPATGGDPRQLTRGGAITATFAGLSWSPDGRWIAFPHSTGESQNIWAVPSAGGRPRQITITPGDDMWLSWSPDGRSLVFSSNTDAEWDIWIVPASGGAATRLVDWPTAEFSPSWSPDGDRIAFGSRRGQSGERDLDFNIWTVPATGGEATWIAPGITPSWSPDGKKILCVNFADQGDIWQIPTAAGSPARLLQTPQPEFLPKWSPDGSRILFIRRRPLNSDIFVADVSGLQKKALE